MPGLYFSEKIDQTICSFYRTPSPTNILFTFDGFKVHLMIIFAPTSDKPNASILEEEVNWQLTRSK